MHDRNKPTIRPTPSLVWAKLRQASANSHSSISLKGKKGNFKTVKGVSSQPKI